MLLTNKNTKEDNFKQHVSFIRQLKTNYFLMKWRIKLDRHRCAVHYEWQIRKF